MSKPLQARKYYRIILIDGRTSAAACRVSCLQFFVREKRTCSAFYLNNAIFNISPIKRAVPNDAVRRFYLFIVRRTCIGDR